MLDPPACILQELDQVFARHRKSAYNLEVVTSRLTSATVPGLTRICLPGEHAPGAGGLSP